MTAPFLVFAETHIDEAKISGLQACLRSGWMGTATRISRFESDFAAYKALMTASLAFCGRVDWILHPGLRPGLKCVYEYTQSVDPDAIEAALTTAMAS